MQRSRFIIILFACLTFLYCLTSFTFAISPNVNDVSYWTFDNTLTDSTGNGWTLTNNGAAYTASGKINGSFDFEASESDYMTTTYKPSGITDFSLSVWIKPEAIGSLLDIYSNNDNPGRVIVRVDGSGEIVFYTITSVGGIATTTTTAGITAGNWYHLVVTYDGVNHRIYLNNTLLKTEGQTGTLTASDAPDIGRQEGATANYFDGLIDELALYEYNLSATDIDDLYFNGSGCQYPYTCDVVPIIQLNITNGQYFNNNIQNISMNTTSNVNMSVYKNAVLIKTINNTSSSSVIVNLTEGSNNLSFKSVDANGFNWNNITVTLDTIKPVINQIGNISNNTFSVNFSNIINVTELNPDTCIINITELENVSTPDNFLINCTDTQVFTSAGLHSAYVVATDLATNSANYTFNFTIIPLVYIDFNDTVNNLIVTNYSLTIYHPDGRTTSPPPDANGAIILSPVNNGTLDLGIHTLEFSKSGYVTENFTYNITETSGGSNVTFNVTPAAIRINIYDRSTGIILNTTTVNINLQGVGNKSTSNGTVIFQNFSIPAGSYHLEAIASGYYTEGKDFTYTGETDATINIFMLNSTQDGVTTLVVPVIDEFFNIIEGADTRLLEYDINILGYKEVSQCDTNSNGECKFLIEVGTKRYIITTSKTINNVLFTAQSTANGEIFLADISDGVPIPGEIFLNNLVLKISSSLPVSESVGLRITAPDTQNDTIVSQNSTTTTINVPVSFIADNGLAYTVCLEIYRVGGTTYSQVINPICTTGSSGILPVSNVLLDRDFNYQVRVTYIYEGDKKLYTSYDYGSTSSFTELLLEQGYIKNVILLFWIILLSVALYLRSIGTWVYGSWTLAAIQGSIFLNVLVSSSSVLIILINIGVLYISKRQGDSL